MGKNSVVEKLCVENKHVPGPVGQLVNYLFFQLAALQIFELQAEKVVCVTQKTNKNSKLVLNLTLGLT